MIKKILIVFCILLFGMNAQMKTKIQLLGGSGNQKKIEAALSDIINSANLSFKSGMPSITNSGVSDNAKNNILKIWQVTPFYCNEDKLKLKLLESPGGKKMEIRNIPLFFREDENIVKQECLVTISPGGVIEDFLIGIEAERYDSLVNSGKGVVDQRRRQIILGFVEEYRTAYNKRDIDFIEKVFSDQAVIIKGVVYMKGVDSEEILKQVPADKIKYVKMTKVEYVSELRKAFKILKYLKVDFEKIEITQHGFKKDLYGVTLFQKWNQGNYKDVGYLFLMIDFRDEDSPKIHVRAWQPEEFIKPTETIKISDFEVF